MVDVVVAGAGPVGLWLACELRVRGVDVLVLEPNAHISPFSKAFTVHPRTIEVLAQRGAADELLDRGHRVPNGHFGVLERRLEFSGLDTPFPYTVLFPQADTERVLQARALRLGAELRRGHRVASAEQNADGVTVEVSGPEGTYRLDCRYLAGCDGTRSTVRETAGIGFHGTDSTVYGFLGDVELSAPPTGKPPPPGKKGLVMLVPIPSGGYRLVGVDPARQNPAGRELPFEEFRETVVRITGSDFGMHSPRWLSRFGNETRVAERYSKGRIVLAGDAAHMHFPAGGVGMNVGIQDAHALGWRLADLVDGLADRSVLDDYHDERHRVGRELARSTRAQTALLCAFDDDRLALRALLNDVIESVPELESHLAEHLAGLSVAYPSSGGHPWVGRRLGALHTGPTADISARGGAILFDPGNRFADLEHDLAGRGIHHVHGPVPHAEPADRDVALVRPDGYVRWAEAEPGSEALRAAIDAFRPSASA
ncbi:FAD-dependent monooxygenase [Nocardiopsis mangrovi]|uniref:FAD-dependent monooxygenase n=1 Tax=Nocardiopsis mangrovi TaxID=1179818 RepID=A0ABV9DXD1_9ACTN